jgi:quercetin dioxygenase-like cupin family protein
MQVAKGRQQGAKSARSSETFSGVVWRDPILNADDVAIATIIFEPASYTNWHAHGAGQLLFIDHGHGVVANRAGEVSALGAADVMYASPDEEHWHGATDDAYLGQTTVSMGTTTWLEAVSEADYRAACEQIRAK